MQSRRTFLAALGGSAAALATLRVPPARAARRQNIVLIMTDDMGYECLGCNGSTTYQTPRLDALAATGMRFEHCYSQPLCTPSRVKIMTGRQNFRNYRRFAHLETEEVTFANVLRAAGYATCIVGKWQLGQDSTLPEHFGFDEHCLWQLSQPRSAGERYAEPLVEKNGELLPRDPDAYGPAVFVDYARDFITRKKDEPFLLYYPMVLPHDPFVPTPDSPEWEEDPHQQNNRFFVDMVAYVDKAVGQIVDHLDALGLRKDTLVMFTSDNGTHRNIRSETRERIVQGGKGLSLDAGCHVPFIANWPGTIATGQVCQHLFDFSDFFPTILELAGAQPPADRIIDGRSFLPLLRGEDYTPRDWIYIHYDPHWGDVSRKSRFARTQRYKLYHDGRFYDVPADPLEESPIENMEAIGPEARAARVMLQEVIDDMERQGSHFRPELD